MINEYTYITEKIDNGAGYWNSLKVTIFCNGKECGSYIRSYSTMYNTFVPFMKDGKEYALFSDDYTKSSVMTLPDCVKIATEESEYYRIVKPMVIEGNKIVSGSECIPATKEEYQEEVKNHPDYRNMNVHKTEGFCPVDFYVPEMEVFAYHPYAKDADGKSFKDKTKMNVCVEVDNRDAKYAFVAGCVWGDDTSWKIECLDLSKIHEGIVGRSARFGYIQMGTEKLSDAIHISEDVVYITETRVYDIDTGEKFW